MNILEHQSGTFQCEKCIVRNKAICAALSEEQLLEFNKIAHHRKLAAGQIIAGDEDVILANILSGVVKLTKTMSDGRQQIVGLQFPPDFLGRTFSKTAPYFAEAATDVELCIFRRESFEVMLKRYPELEHKLFENTLNELDCAREWMLLLGRKSAQEKVASLLLMLAHRAPNVGCNHSPDMNFAQFTLPLTRADLADYIGLTLETVSRQMTKLKTAGVIELIDNREVLVPDIERLQQIADG